MVAGSLTVGTVVVAGPLTIGKVVLAGKAMAALGWARSDMSSVSSLMASRTLLLLLQGADNSASGSWSSYNNKRT